MLLVAHDHHLRGTIDGGWLTLKRMCARVSSLHHTIRCVVKLLDFLGDSSSSHEAFILSILLLSVAHHMLLLTCLAPNNASICDFNCAFELGWRC